MNLIDIQTDSKISPIGLYFPLKMKFVYLLLFSFFLNCFPLQRTDKVTKDEWNKLARVRKFTVLVYDDDGKEAVNLELKRAGLFFNKTDYNSRDMVKLNSLYGQAIRRAFQVMFDYKENQMPDYIPPEKLALIYNESNEGDHNRAWLASIGIDAVFTINQKSLVLDYNTRVQDISFFNFFYTFLLLDLWYIDFSGIWYLKNEISYTVQFTRSGKWYRVEDQRKAEILGALSYKTIDKTQLEDAIMQTAFELLMSSWDYD